MAAETAERLILGTFHFRNSRRRKKRRQTGVFQTKTTHTSNAMGTGVGARPLKSRGERGERDIYAPRTRGTSETDAPEDLVSLGSRKTRTRENKSPAVRLKVKTRGEQIKRPRGEAPHHSRR